MQCACVSNFGDRTASIPAASPFTTRPRNGRRSPSPAPRRAGSPRPGGFAPPRPAPPPPPPALARGGFAEACGFDLALDDQNLPHMAFTTGVFDGAPFRIARVSFTGDRSYELSVPENRAGRLRARLSEKLPAFGGGLMGLEALVIL